MPVKALLFDLDDTLLPSVEIYANVLRRIGVPGTSAAYVKARAAVKKRLGEKHPASHNRLLYFKEMGRADALDLMARYEKALARECAAAWKRMKRPALFKKLSARYTLAIISNENTRTQLIKLRAMDPRGRLFKTMVTSEEVGVEKPDLKIFREALRRLKIKPQQCAMIGDSLSADINPMKRLGAKTLLVHKADLTTLEGWLS